MTDKNKFDKIMLEITSACNLQCPICYNRNSTAHLSLKEVQKIIAPIKNTVITISGGEPTLHPELPQIIKLIAKKNIPVLVTNGLKLADSSYLESLTQSGLQFISLSFNGFSSHVYEKINGDASIYSAKLAALQAIKANQRCKLIISFLLAKNINEAEIFPTLKYCLENSDFISEFRIRSVFEKGSSLNSSSFSIAEMVRVLCRECGFLESDLICENNWRKDFNTIFKTSLFLAPDCSFDFHLNDSVPLGKQISALNYKKTKISLLLSFIKLFGINVFLRSAFSRIFGIRSRLWIHNHHFLKIGLRAWPTHQQLDPYLKHCRSGKYYRGDILPFCYTNNIISNTNEQR